MQRADIDADDVAQASRLRLWARRLGLLLGVGLMILAVMMVLRQRATLEAAWSAIQSTPARTLAASAAILLATVVANIVLSGLLFSLLISRYGRVGWMEMQALIASATLMNYLPARPGFFGRLAYHKAVNRIALVDSAKTTVQAALISALCAGWLALAVIAAARLGMRLPLLVLAPLPLLLGGFISRGETRRWLLALLMRYLEVLVIAVRYFVVFRLIGSPIESASALAFACVSMIAGMVPLLSNGLGLREWAVGLAAPLLTPYEMALGITADLVNRAAELIVATLSGLVGMALLARMRRR